MNGGFRVGEWLVQPTLGRASRDEQTVHLRPKVMDLLVCLAEKTGTVCSKDDILGSIPQGLEISGSPPALWLHTSQRARGTSAVISRCAPSARVDAPEDWTPRTKDTKENTKDTKK